MHRFISADSVIAGVSEDVNGYNLFEYGNNNPVNCQDESGNFPELSNTQKVAIGLGVITVLAVSAVVTGGASCVVMGALIGSCTGAVSGAASGAVISGGIEYLKTRDMQATKQAAIDGAADGFMWGSVTGAVTGGMTSPYCFVAGTLVCTIDGEVPIEDIEVGDYVLAENPETGEIDYKPVLETYEHDTYDVVYLTIDGEEFTTTEGHPFYVEGRGFVKAAELRYSDNLLDSEGKHLHLEYKEIVHLEEPVTVYNFAVEDYHTYFIGENKVFVHNRCKLGENMIKEGGFDPGPGFDAHHIFPRKFQKYFDGLEIDINNPDFGIWLKQSTHRSSSYSYNQLWESFFSKYKPGEVPMDDFIKFFNGLKQLW
ncbi:intein N-terminal splicing region [Pseudobutyrivibrio sp. OR37]|nr:intein N-terminal splicing region [Pseudobutyrivibrio sp. OR37]